ncbi:MAG: ATP-dependent helicase HrpB [Proteobacteria bacterium]|nr:ATP-dependent helicase HrpB [Pseudomonadota bacterium]
MRRAVEHALSAHAGDLLVFLPGQREIAQVQKALAHSSPSPDGRGVAERGLGSERKSGLHDSESPSSGAPHHLLPEGEGKGRGVHVLPLHGELSIDAQAAVLAPHDECERRVVLATNVAESSVTLPGVRVVIDTGLAREPRFDPNTGFSRLQTVAISQASADQRVGRAGRVAEGFAYRLWPQSQRLEAQRHAEIVQVDLSALALELAAWGAADLRFLDPPPPGALAAARDLLRRLGALDGEDGTMRGAITPLGRHMLALGTHPRLAAMLLASADARDGALACDLAALLEARDPLRSRSDALVERWQALAQFRAGRVGADANRSALAQIDQAAKQWRRRLRIEVEPPREIPAHALGDLLAHAFPDRIARQSSNDARRYQLANGRSARLFDDSALYGEPWLVVAELRALRPAQGDRGDAQILRAAPLDEARLERDFPQRFVSADRTVWDASRRAILAVRERRFERIVLESKPLARPDPQRCADALIAAVRDLGLGALPWTAALTQWRTRVRCLRAWLPASPQSTSARSDLVLPDLSDTALLASLETWLKPALTGLSRLDAIDPAAFADALKASIDWNLRQRIDDLAPIRIRVPSGLERGIDYGYDEHADTPLPPVLAVKLQELFGLADTPRIADGRVALTLHLLSPGGKPLQVTQDLRGFWDRTYPEVRKEMKGRYPRHPWPEDPWSAVATHRAKPRGT